MSYHLDSTLLSPKDQESWSELGMMQGKVFERKKYGRDCGLCRWEKESIKDEESLHYAATFDIFYLNFQILFLFSSRTCFNIEDDIEYL